MRQHLKMLSNDLYWHCALIKLAAFSICSAFNIASVDVTVDNYTLGLEKLVPALRKCTREWGPTGVSQRTMLQYSRRPRNYRTRTINDLPEYNCAWGCFFINMGWLDEIEGAFWPYKILPNLPHIVSRKRVGAAIISASRCVYVNFPHQPPMPPPDCQQARLLKRCLIEETIQNITAEDKLKFRELVNDWAWVCAETYRVPMRLLRAKARGQFAAHDPPELGCVWRCLFEDLHWIELQRATFMLSVVQETIRLYYGVEENISQLVAVATKCATGANKLREVDTHLIEGCQRAAFFVDCLLRDYFYK